MLKQSRIGKSSQAWAARLLARCPLSPNEVTMLALMLAIVGFCALAAGALWAAVFFFVLSALCDLADGVLARLRRQTSAQGAFLDGVTDRLVEFLLIAGLMLYPAWPTTIAADGTAATALSSILLAPMFLIPAWAWLTLLLFFGSNLTAFIPAYAYYRGIRVKKEWEGFLPRPERLSIMLLSLALLPLGYPLTALALLCFAALLSILTAAGRLAHYLDAGQR